MCRDSFLGNAVHFLGPDLDLELVSALSHHRGVERLIQVWPRHGDVVFEPARNRPPDVMHHAERGIAVSLRIGDHADGE